MHDPKVGVEVLTHLLHDDSASQPLTYSLTCMQVCTFRGSSCTEYRALNEGNRKPPYGAFSHRVSLQDASNHAEAQRPAEIALVVLYA